MPFEYINIRSFNSFLIMCRYILSMTDAEDLKDYMLSLLDGSDPAVQKFIPQLITRWQAFGAGHNNELVSRYR